MKVVIFLSLITLSSLVSAKECEDGMAAAVVKQISEGLGKIDKSDKLEKLSHHEFDYKCSVFVQGVEHTVHKEEKSRWYALEIKSGPNKGFYGSFDSSI